MNAICRHLARDLRLHFETRIQTLEQGTRGWNLRDHHAQLHGEFDVVVVALPPLQSQALLNPWTPQWQDAFESVVMQPCLTVMLSFATSLAGEIDGFFVEEGPLAWIARDSSKPQRHGEHWVLQANAAWSDAHRDAPAEIILETLIAAFWKTLDVSPLTPTYATSHRWLYARVERPLSVSCLWDPTLRLGVAGDWCGGSKIEAAFLSGMALAGQVLQVPCATVRSSAVAAEFTLAHPRA